MIYIKLFFVLLFHKACVFRAGLWTGAPIWQLLTHDKSKFYPSEFPYYTKFYGRDVSEEEFLACWLKHQNRNPHHWEFWVSRPKCSTGYLPHVNWAPVPMPMKYVREMIADWMGASRTYSGYWPDPDNWEWFDKHYPDMILHDTTKERMKIVMDELKM